MANIINFPSGKVGIGTENPQQTLDIAGTLRLSGSTGTGTTLMARNASGDVSAVTIGVGLNLSNNSLTATGGGTGTVSGSGTATQIAFWDGATGTTSSSLASSANLYWNNVNSRLGVGTNTPTRTLDVVGDLSIGSSHKWTISSNIFSLPNSTNAFISLQSDRYLNITNSSSTVGIISFDHNNRNTFIGNRISNPITEARLVVAGSGITAAGWTAQFHNSGGTNNSLVIRNDGNVGVGTVDLNSRLQVQGADTSDTGWTAQFHNSLGNSNSLMIRNDGNVGIGTTGTTARLIIQGTGSSSAATMAVVNSGGTNSLRVLDNGSVLVNLTNASSPITLFEVNSRGRFWGGIELGGFAIARIDGSGNYFKNVTGSNGFGFYNTSGFNGTIGQFFWSEFSTNINPTSGSAEFSVLKLSPTFNLSGTAATTVIGLDYNPVINSIVNGKNYAALFRSGSVGIGTSTPVQTLDVAGTMRLTGSTGTGTTLMARNADGDVSAVTVGSGLNLSNNTLTATGGGTGAVSGSGTATQIAFWGGTTGSTSTALSGSSNLYWDGINNRLGIGTSTPAARLDVGNGVIGITGSIGFTNNSRMITFNDANNGMLYTGFGGHRFSVFNQTTYQNALVITGNSPTPNVGIAVEAPVARLQVQGSDTSDTGWTAQFHNSLGNNNSLMIRNDGNVGVGTSGTTARFVVRASGSSTGSTAMLIQNSGGTTLLRVREDGNVGIGTAEPTNRLYVDGSTYVGSLTVLGGINSITGSIFLASARSIQFGSNTSIIGQDGSSGFIRYTVNNNEIFRATTTSIGIGTITPAQTLHVAGTMRLTGSTGTGTTLMARNADGDVSAVTVGSGLNLSNNTLTATGGGSGTVSGSGTATQVAFWDNTTSLAGNSNLYWDNVNSRLGVGITTPTSNLDVVGSVEFQNPSTAFDGGVLGSELLTTGTGTNWTGTSFATGYLHATGSTVALVSSASISNGQYYQVVVTVSGRTTGSITFSIGGYTSSSISTNTTTTVGPFTTSTASFTVTPTNDFDGTVLASVKVITAGSASFVGKNSAGTIVYEERLSNSTTNIFQGINAGPRNTTGLNNIFIGPSAGNSNTTGNNNLFIGLNAGLVNSIANNNTFIGTSAGFSNTIGDSNTFIGAGAGVNNTSGSNNFFLGRNTGLSNTIGVNNLYIGTFSGVFSVSGGSNVYLGGNTGRNNVGGSSNVLIGLNAGRYYSESTLDDTSINNSIFIGAETRSTLSGQTNQIIIANNGRGLGSNTTVLGNTSTVQTHLHGNLTLGSTSSPTARMVVVGSGSSNTGWTAQFHNVLGNSNSLMIRDDGNVGFGTDAPTGKIDARSDSGVIAFFGVANGGTRLSVNSNGRVGLGLVGWIPTTDGGQNITTGAGGCFIGYDASGDLAYTNVASVTLGRPLNRLLNATTNTQRMVDIVGNFSPTSGNATFYDLGIIPIINQTGGASGITRGVFVNPTLTAAANWRSIEWTNNSGFGLYGSGTATNYLAGSLGIGTDAPAQTLHVAGTMRLTGSTGTGTTLMARNANGDVSAVTLGTGVVLSNNVISVALSPKAETPSGLVNGSNITYTLASTPIANQSVMVFLNGVAQYNGIDYTVSGTTITFGTAPANGSSIFAYYMA
jgi:hypothetical protein